MVVWLKGEEGEAVRLVDRWSPSMYISTDNRTDSYIPLKVVKQEQAVVLAVIALLDEADSPCALSMRIYIHIRKWLRRTWH